MIDRLYSLPFFLILQISERLGPMRTDVQCLHRWNKVLKPGLHKGPWRDEEDVVVKDIVLEHGVGKVKWSAIAAKVWKWN